MHTNDHRNRPIPVGKIVPLRADGKQHGVYAPDGSLVHRLPRQEPLSTLSDEALENTKTLLIACAGTLVGTPDSRPVLEQIVAIIEEQTRRVDARLETLR